jgi:hypothetical protein
LHGTLIKSEQTRELIHSTELYNRIKDNLDKLDEIVKKTEEREHFATCIKGLGEIRSTLELLVKIAAYMHETQETEKTIITALHKVFTDDAARESIERLTTEELRWFHHVLKKLLGVGGVIDAQRPSDIPSRPIHISGGSEGNLERDKGYKSGMVRTTTPPDSDAEIERDEQPQMHSPDQQDHQDLGVSEDAEPEEDEPIKVERPEPIDPRKVKPRWPMSTIHFETPGAYVGHLYGRKKRKRK